MKRFDVRLVGERGQILAQRPRRGCAVEVERRLSAAFWAICRSGRRRRWGAMLAQKGCAGFRNTGTVASLIRPSRTRRRGEERQFSGSRRGCLHGEIGKILRRGQGQSCRQTHGCDSIKCLPVLRVDTIRFDPLLFPRTMAKSLIVGRSLGFKLRRQLGLNAVEPA